MSVEIPIDYRNNTRMPVAPSVDTGDPQLSSLINGINVTGLTARHAILDHLDSPEVEGYVPQRAIQQLGQAATDERFAKTAESHHGHHVNDGTRCISDEILGLAPHKEDYSDSAFIDPTNTRT